MQILTLIVQLALMALLVSCDRQQSAPDVDPMLGLECFENHRATLPPGTQYEGRNGPRFLDSRLSVICPHILRPDHAATGHITLPS